MPVLSVDVERERMAGAVAKLYEVFGNYPLRATTSPCLHCHSLEDEAKLHAKRLRDLSIEDLRDFASDALMTWGDEIDFKHFLPRIYEIVATADFHWPDLEVVYAHLGRANWRAWPVREQKAVEEYLLAKWRTTLAEFPARHAVGTVLCALAQSVSDMEAFLDVWLEAEGDAPLRHLASLLWHDGMHLVGSGSLTNAFWSSEQRVQQRQIREWLRAPALRDKLEAAFFATTDKALQKELSDAVAILDALCT